MVVDDNRDQDNVEENVEEVNKLKKNLNEVGEKTIKGGGHMVIEGNIEDILPKDVPVVPEVPTTLPTLILRSSTVATGSSMTIAATREAATKLQIRVPETSKTPEIASTSREAVLVEQLQDLRNSLIVENRQRKDEKQKLNRELHNLKEQISAEKSKLDQELMHLRELHNQEVQNLKHESDNFKKELTELHNKEVQSLKKEREKFQQEVEKVKGELADLSSKKAVELVQHTEALCTLRYEAEMKAWNIQCEAERLVGNEKMLWEIQQQEKEDELKRKQNSLLKVML